MKTVESKGYVYEIGKKYRNINGHIVTLLGESVNQMYPLKTDIGLSAELDEIKDAGSVTKAAYKPEIGKLYEFSDVFDFYNSCIGVLSKINNDSSYAFIDDLEEKYQFIRPVPEDKREFGV